MVDLSLGSKIFLIITSFNAFVLFLHGLNPLEFGSFIFSILILLGIHLYQYLQEREKKKRRQRLLHDEEKIILSSGPTTTEILMYLFLPDATELSFLFIGYLFVIEILVPSIHLPLDLQSPVFYIYYGLTLMFLYYMRWGYSSINNVMKRIENKLNELFQENAEKKHVIDLKLFGIILSTSLTLGSYLLWFKQF